MTTTLLIVSAALLALERVTYAAIWHRPHAFAVWVTRHARAPYTDPVQAVRGLFVGFKAVQVVVFATWVAVHGLAWPLGGGPVGALAGVTLVGAGQTLNAGVFRALGTAGVFYGNRFGRQIPWSRGFPFSLVAHPQYLGATLTIWGVFLLVRYPGADWWLLPAVETLYYLAAVRLERD